MLREIQIISELTFCEDIELSLLFNHYSMLFQTRSTGSDLRRVSGHSLDSNNKRTLRDFPISESDVNLVRSLHCRSIAAGVSKIVVIVEDRLQLPKNIQHYINIS